MLRTTTQPATVEARRPAGAGAPAHRATSRTAARRAAAPRATVARLAESGLAEGGLAEGGDRVDRPLDVRLRRLRADHDRRRPDALDRHRRGKGAHRGDRRRERRSRRVRASPGPSRPPRRGHPCRRRCSSRRPASPRSVAHPASAARPAGPPSMPAPKWATPDDGEHPRLGLIEDLAAQQRGVVLADGRAGDRGRRDPGRRARRPSRTASPRRCPTGSWRAC